MGHALKCMQDEYTDEEEEEEEAPRPKAVLKAAPRPAVWRREMQGRWGS